jgi:hypothetical protein
MRWASMYQVDVGNPKLKREKSRPIKIRDMETDPNEHMLSIYAEHMLECRACGRRFEKMPQLAGHYRMHTQTNLLKALAEKLDRQNMLLEKILLELESIHSLLEKLNIVEAKIEEESVVSKIAPATLEAGEKEEAGLPSFLRENL